MPVVSPLAVDTAPAGVKIPPGVKMELFQTGDMLTDTSQLQAIPVDLGRRSSVGWGGEVGSRYWRYNAGGQRLMVGCRRRREGFVGSVLLLLLLLLLLATSVGARLRGEGLADAAAAAAAGNIALSSRILISNACNTR
jgi:hypothetical protein